MSPLTTLRLSVAGSSSDRVRIVLTAISSVLATLSLLCAATVTAIAPSRAERYTNDLLNGSGLRPGVALAMVLLTIPALTLVAQCSRLGAPAREHRLAAIRMAGATPRQVIRIVAVETGLASVPGVTSGFAVFLIGRALLDAPDAQGRRPLPTDVLPNAAAMAGVALGVPLVVAALTVLTLRRAALTPLGVVRRTRRARPRITPGVLILIGLGACALVEPVHSYFTRHPQNNDLPMLVTGGLILIGVLAVGTGVVSGTGWITHTIGRLLQRYARKPAGLLAGRRMTADPWSGSRTFSAMLVALVIGSAAAGLAALTVASVSAQQENTRRFAALVGEPYKPAGTGLYSRAYELVGYASLVALVIAAAGLLVALADTVLAQRRALASLIATGTPRGILARAIGWQTLTPVAPAVGLAVLAGVLLPRFAVPDAKDTMDMQTWRCSPLPGDSASACLDPAYSQAHSVQVSAEKVPVTVHTPWDQVLLLAGTAITATVVITLVALLFLRMSTRAGELRTA
ncbi:FtsX-like permease family protein [Streptomyces sp. NPDC002870]|uniref:FtsX-like permease family protein n=1 Tax=Streptomyces sp. NPDC002870 TaxID=3364666 RepID=UPI0036D19E51